MVKPNAGRSANQRPGFWNSLSRGMDDQGYWQNMSRMLDSYHRIGGERRMPGMPEDMSTFDDAQFRQRKKDYREDYWAKQRQDAEAKNYDRFAYQLGATLAHPYTDLAYEAALTGALAYGAVRLLRSSDENQAHENTQQQMLSDPQMQAYLMQQQQRWMTQPQMQPYLASPQPMNNYPIY